MLEEHESPSVSTQSVPILLCKIVRALHEVHAKHERFYSERIKTFSEGKLV